HSCTISKGKTARQQSVDTDRGTATQALGSNAFQGLGRKCVDQHIACIFHGHAARTQIEQTVCIQLTHRSTVCTLDVISVDFQLGAGVRTGHLGQEQAVRALYRIRTIRALADQYTTAEYTTGSVGQNNAVKLTALAVGLSVINDGVVVNVTAAVYKVQTIEQGFAALAIEDGSNIVTGDTGTEGQGVRIEYRATTLLHIDCSQVKVLQRFLLQLHVRQVGIRRHVQASHEAAEGSMRSLPTYIVFNHRCAGTGLQRNQVTRETGAATLGAHKNQMNRLLQMLASSNVQGSAILGQSQVQGGGRGAQGLVPVSLLQPVCILFQTGAERRQTHARWQLIQVRQSRIVVTIYENQEIPVFLLAHRRHQFCSRSRLLRRKALLFQQGQGGVMPGFNTRSWPAF